MKKLEKAILYLKEGRVLLKEETEKAYFFKIKGKEEYLVRIGKNLSFSEMSCTCKYFSVKTDLCSHILASLLYLAKKKGLK